MRIVIDLQGAQTASRFRGIGRYTVALTRGILRNAGGHEVWLVVNGALEEAIDQVRADFAGLLPQDRIRVFEIPGRVAEMDASAAARCRAAEILREQFIAMLEPDMVLVTSLFEGYIDDAVGSVGTFVDGTRTAVILYDLIPLLNPDAYLGSPYVRQCYMRKIDSLKRAGLLLSISEYAREEALEALGLPAHRVVPISTAVDESFMPTALTPADLAATRQRFGITRAMLMCAPGGYDARKNIFGLIKAYGLLPPALRATHQLLIASKLTDDDRHALTAHASRCGLAADELVLTGYVSDRDLIALYQAATLFVFPSLHEGFGMPALEAMACGTPAIGSNTTSIPEVIGMPEAMFDPHTPEAIADKIAEVLGDPALHERLRQHGRVQAAKFSWDRTAQRALLALEAQCAASVRPPAPQRADLLRALGAIPGLADDDATLVQLAQCMAALPDPALPRQLLVDLGTAPSAGADQVAQKMPTPPAHLKVETVFLSNQGGVWHYRYAGTPGHPVADLRTGDILCSLGARPETLAAAFADGLHTHLRRHGVELHFVVDPELDADPSPATPANWLDSLYANADVLVCHREASARAFESRRAARHPRIVMAQDWTLAAAAAPREDASQQLSYN